MVQGGEKVNLRTVMEVGKKFVLENLHRIQHFRNKNIVQGDQFGILHVDNPALLFNAVGEAFCYLTVNGLRFRKKTNRRQKNGGGRFADEQR